MVVSLQGFLCCDKPVGMTSRDLVNIVTGRINAGVPRRQRTKVGHCGTLDPLATGVLVVGVGSAVRLTSFVGEQAKHYRATFRLGQSTVSGDLEGEITHHEDLPMPNRVALEASSATWVGEITQIPPAHSAIWVDGVRAYKRARAGQTVEMPSRRVRVDSIQLSRFEPPDFEIDVVCGGGTYIRTLGIDIAKGAGSMAVMASLRRVAVGPFRIEDAIPIDQIRDPDCELPLQPMRQAVTHRKCMDVTAEQASRLSNGLPIADESPIADKSRIADRSPVADKSPVAGGQELGTHDVESFGYDEVPAIDPDGVLRAIVYRRDQRWHPKRVFPRHEA